MKANELPTNNFLQVQDIQFIKYAILKIVK